MKGKKYGVNVSGIEDVSPSNSQYSKSSGQAMWFFLINYPSVQISKPSNPSAQKNTKTG